MSNNNLKKTIVFTNLENKNIIENYLNLNYIVNNQTASGAIESFMLNSILPTNEDAKYWAKRLLLDSSKIGKILSDIYSFLAAGIDWKSGAKTNTQLVMYTLSQLKFNFNDNVEKESYYFFKCYDSIIQIFENHLDNLNNTPLEERNENHTLEMYEIEKRIHGLKETRNSKEFFYASDFTYYIVSTLIKHWDLVSNYTMTFRFLSCLSRIQYFSTSPGRVLELLEILKDISKNW